MTKDLTGSNLHRQNILNNRFALEQLEKVSFAFNGVLFQGTKVFTKAQVARILDVEERTINRYLRAHSTELKKNGYKLLKGEDLADFKLEIFARDINVLNKTRQISLFQFKTVLNLAMLLTESEKARQIRLQILDIAIEVITHKAGNTTYINQRDEDYLVAAFQEENYNKIFADALNKYIDSKETSKIGKYINQIYKAIFDEDAEEYRAILRLKEKDEIKDAFYSEVLDLVASFEAGFAEALEKRFDENNKKLTISEADTLFAQFSTQAAFRPLITKAKTIMASRDYNLRDAIHEKLGAYIQAMPERDYERFLGEKSKALEERIKESLNVYKRLKDR